MSHYKHFSIRERESLAIMRAEGKNNREIAKALGRHPSSIGRELRRNSKGDQMYSPSEATKQYEKRRKKCVRKRILANKEKGARIRQIIETMHWSPMQISNRLKYEQGITISSDTIYRAIYDGILNQKGERKTKGKYPLNRKLRRKGKKKKIGDKRGQIKNARSIDERPQAAADRIEIGHWEIDCVGGIKGGAVLVTIIDRATRLYLVGRSPSQSAEDVKMTLVKLLRPYVGTSYLKTITADRGKEFTQHEEISALLGGVPIYFAHPHSPWERGSNENANGLIREFIPKFTDINLYSDDYIQHAVDLINFRPRKCLDWKCAFEVFHGVLLHLV